MSSTAKPLLCPRCGGTRWHRLEDNGPDDPHIRFGCASFGCAHVALVQVRALPAPRSPPQPRI